MQTVGTAQRGIGNRDRMQNQFGDFHGNESDAPYAAGRARDYLREPRRGFFSEVCRVFGLFPGGLRNQKGAACLRIPL